MHDGKPLWQIGTLDRTAKEFRHGDEYRQWGLWMKYPQEFPNDVNFIIGKSRERADLRLEFDNAMIRAGIHGQYTEEDVPFDAALLKLGENKITLEQHRGGNNLFNVMYDCVRLELDEDGAL
jgi:hypothetical protein